jgi:hypothetical protein
MEELLHLMQDILNELKEVNTNLSDLSSSNEQLRVDVHNAVMAVEGAIDRSSDALIAESKMHV